MLLLCEEFVNIVVKYIIDHIVNDTIINYIDEIIEVNNEIIIDTKEYILL
jgi:hypothetical protein